MSTPSHLGLPPHSPIIGIEETTGYAIKPPLQNMDSACPPVIDFRKFVETGEQRPFEARKSVTILSASFTGVPSLPKSPPLEAAAAAKPAKTSSHSSGKDDDAVPPDWVDLGVDSDAVAASKPAETSSHSSGKKDDTDVSGWTDLGFDSEDEASCAHMRDLNSFNKRG